MRITLPQMWALKFDGRGWRLSRGDGRNAVRGTYVDIEAALADAVVRGIVKAADVPPRGWVAKLIEPWRVGLDTFSLPDDGRHGIIGQRYLFVPHPAGDGRWQVEDLRVTPRQWRGTFDTLSSAVLFAAVDHGSRTDLSVKRTDLRSLFEEEVRLMVCMLQAGSFDEPGPHTAVLATIRDREGSGEGSDGKIDQRGVSGEMEGGR